MVVSLVFTPNANASDEINLSEIPTRLAHMLGIDVFTASILATGIFFLAFFLPGSLLTRSTPALVIIGMIPLGVCISMGWLPIWFFGIIIMLIAFRVANWAKRQV